MQQIAQKALKRAPRYSLARLMNDGEEVSHDVNRRPYPTYSSHSAAKRAAKLLNGSLGSVSRWRYVAIEL